MKVNGTEAAISAVPRANGADAAAARGADASADKGLKAAGGLDRPSQLQLSARVAEADKVAELAKEVPEYRAEVVAEARADMKAGRLTASSSDLAQAMFAEFF